jgi:hypothetical protein
MVGVYPKQLEAGRRNGNVLYGMIKEAKRSFVSTIILPREKVVKIKDACMSKNKKLTS